MVIQTLASSYTNRHVKAVTKLRTIMPILQVKLCLFLNITSSYPSIVMGDFNAHFGQSSENKYSCHSITNSNGQIATDSIQENDLTTTNTNFKKRNGKLWTFISDCSGAKSQVDYIMVRING